MQVKAKNAEVERLGEEKRVSDRSLALMVSALAAFEPRDDLCGRVARLATRQGFLHLSTPTLLPSHHPLALWRDLLSPQNV